MNRLMTVSYRVLILFVTVPLISLPAWSQTNETVRAKSALQGGGKVVFLGDSITQAGEYLVDIQCWLISRGIGNHVVNLGLGSETVTDLTPEENAGHVQAHQFPRPAIRERLGRALRLTRPDLLFVCYGMNDGGALPGDESGMKRFTDAITLLRETALKSGVRRVIVCTPPVHDDKGDVSKAFHDANLSRYATWLLSKRHEGWEVVDFHTPMRKTLDEGRAADPAFVLAADGTHPGREGHWIMAKQVLQEFFGADPIAATNAENLFPSRGAEIRAQVRELTDLRFNYWMARIGHHRPGVIGGPDQRGNPDTSAFEAGQTAKLRSIHALWSRTQSSSMDRLVIGSPQVIYQDAQMPYTMDASWATLRDEDGNTTFFQTAMGLKPYYFRHSGIPDAPLNSKLTPYSFDYRGHNETWPSGCWLPNIYQQSDGTLIGFVHREDLHPSNGRADGGNNFFIGIATSHDRGVSWTYLGDVLATRGNGSTNPGFANSGGVPYLIVNGYAYIYFNERSGPNASDERFLSVARASLLDLAAASATHTSPRFQKYSNGTWNEDGMTGMGSEIITGSRCRNDSPTAYDFHSDAAYCKPLGRYLITVQTHAANELKLYSSSNGVDWVFEKNLDVAPGCMLPYSSIVGFGKDSAADSHEVGNEFYIYYPRKNLSSYDEDTLCRIQCTIRP